MVPVWPRLDRVLIVASGPSLKGVNRQKILETKAKIIAVNGAIEWLPRADYWFTLDSSQTNMNRMRNRRQRCAYIAALPIRFALPPFVLRIARMEGNVNTPENSELLGRRKARAGLSEFRGGVHTGNSAYGALGIAYFCKPRKIGILGVDGTQEERVEGGRPNDLSHLPELFATAVDQLQAAGIAVHNGSPSSRIDCFPRTSAEELLEWLQQS